MARREIYAPEHFAAEIEEITSDPRAKMLLKSLLLKAYHLGVAHGGYNMAQAIGVDVSKVYGDETNAA